MNVNSELTIKIHLLMAGHLCSPWSRWH